jgi:predicted phosphohydrolase
MARRYFSVQGATRLFVAVVAVAALGFQIYAVAATRRARTTPLPALFGNGPEVVKALQARPVGDTFTFAVVGDTKSLGTFERVAQMIRRANPDFVVLLGDCTFDGTQEEHDYLRVEMADEIDFTRPTFYLTGNHDVNEAKYPVARFEQTYGPSNFSFEYGNCLFIGMRILDPPYNNEESLAYLRSLSKADLGKYRHRFLMMHIPPPVSPDFQARTYPESGELLNIIDQMNIDYVLAGDFHGYCRTQVGQTNYLISGGGGARLNKKHGRQFNHAIFLRVGSDYVSEQILMARPANDWEDMLEHAAIVHVAPFCARYPWQVVLVDVLFILLAAKIVVRGRWARE